MARTMTSVSRMTRREFFCGLGAMAVAAGVSLPIGLGSSTFMGTASKFVERDGVYDLHVWNIRLTPEEIHLLAEGVSPALIRPGQIVSWYPNKENSHGL